jgi:hypothetical protein
MRHNTRKQPTADLANVLSQGLLAVADAEGYFDWE